jgi:hypothetical protein
VPRRGLSAEFLGNCAAGIGRDRDGLGKRGSLDRRNDDRNGERCGRRDQRVVVERDRLVFGSGGLRVLGSAGLVRGTTGDSRIRAALMDSAIERD